ncbi:MAG: hypothetical protein MMC23_001509 [Stictis urceolatum]|nr:hypothetical protein [Stictis urceolata]
MLPDLLVDSYKRYKADTTIFITWLVETAESCGFVRHSPPPQQQIGHAQIGRLKGRARIEAKAHPNSVNAKSVPPSYPVSIDDLLPWARTMAHFTKPRQLVPMHVLKAASKAIERRKECSTWFQNHRPSCGDSNITHSYFIQVLEAVLIELKPCMRIQGPTLPPGHVGKPEEVHGVVQNMIERLSSEESADLTPQEVDCVNWNQTRKVMKSRTTSKAKTMNP